MVINSEQYIVGISTILICVFGLALNAMALFLLFRLKELQNAFGYMCTSHVFANLGLLLCFLFWGVPMTFTKSVLSESDIGKMIAGICILFWEVSLYSHVFVALNRFFAIYMPIQYMAIYKNRTTFTFITVSWILAIIHVSPFFINGCGIHYVPEAYLWLYDETPCSQWIAKYLDFYLSCFWIFIIAIFDGLNFCRICRIWRGLSTVTVTGQRMRREMLFFGQAFCQNILFALANFVFHWASFWFTDTISLYFIITFYWGIIHTADGLILLGFNYGMHRKKVMTSLNILFKSEPNHSSTAGQYGVNNVVTKR